MLGEVMEERFHHFSGCFTRETSTWCISCLKGCDFVNLLLDWCNGLASIFVIQCNYVADIADSTMNGYLEPRRNSNDNQSVRTSGSVSCPITASLNQEDKSKSRKPRLSYADLHHEITKNINAIPTDSVGNNQKQRISKRKTEEDELIKYMSKLPSYLERGKNLQEKVLNIGVLDWGRLEKWQHSHKQMPYGSSRTINVNESAMVKKNGSAAVQALVRVAVKNGVPLFTFAVDNDIAILAATMKLNTSKNDDCSCIYTFFSIQEVKKKTATWMHPGSQES
ncbi:hypothetical protein C1H46_020423 [Malus baccata]|uniref:Uncharacterized protein n=1 Tax=Malus baccata TaxID=106549 RepID=A0A540M5L7_MALBA|nr:hypothetical protein C1H46_020423 [Malus baccata]